MNDRELISEFLSRIQPKINRFEERELSSFKPNEQYNWKCVERKFEGDFLNLTFFYDDGDWRETHISSISIDELLTIDE